MSKPIVISLGEILWDMLPTGKRAGGAPVNFAYHASQNGAESFAISAVGNDELGTELLSDAHKAGINTLVQTNEYPTGTVAVVQRKILILLSLKFLNQLISQVFYLLL